jgi:hypothetical protein
MSEVNRKWTYLYDENTIEVFYLGLATYRLHVNEQMQDEKINFIPDSLTLRGELESGEVIQASFKETKTVECTLYVDDKLLQQNVPYPIEQKTTPNTCESSSCREVMIIKEIVKIPCSYCSQLFDITTDKCPNCSAKNVYCMR